MYGATVGRLGVLGLAAATNQACCAVFGGQGLDQRFLYWWLWLHREHLVSMAYGAGQPNISQDLVRGLRVPAPDETAQGCVADRIEQEAERSDQARSRLLRQLDLLVERRQALITAAVTGELDIAGVAA
jgi:type I restriction enzyme S subunit